MGLVLYVNATLEVDFIVLIVSILFIPIVFVQNAIAAICLGCKPQVFSYGKMAAMISKILIGIILVFVLQLGIMGFIIAIIGESIISSITMLILIRSKNVFGMIDKNYIRYTFSMSWLTLYMNVNTLIRSMDVLIIPIITGSLTIVAYWGIGMAISRFIEYSGAMTYGLYAKILATGDTKYAIDNLRYTLFVAIPILASIIALSKPILFVLNPLYGHISIPVILFSFHVFLYVIFTFSINVLRGKDEIDVDKKNNFKSYINSDLFKTNNIGFDNAIIDASIGMATNNVYRKLSIAYLVSPVASIFAYRPYVIAPEYSMNRLIAIPIPQYATIVNDPVIIGIIKTSILRIKVFTFMYNVNHDIEKVYRM